MTNNNSTDHPSAVVESEITSVELERSLRISFAVAGGLLVLIGLAAMLLPMATAIALEVLVALALLLAGVGYGIHAATARRWEGVWWPGLWSLLYIAAGIMLLAFPMAGIASLAMVISIAFVLEGVSKLLLAARLSCFVNRQMLVADGVLGTALGILIWSGWPGDSAWVLGLLTGLRFLISGSLLLILSCPVMRHGTKLDDITTTTKEHKSND